MTESTNPSPQAPKRPPVPQWRHWRRVATGAIRMLLRVAIVLAVVAGGIYLVGYAQRSGWLQSSDDASGAGGASATDASSRYMCPMMCVPPTSQPGRCPVCGMELVVASETQGDGVSVTIDPVARRIAGIQTSVATRDEVFHTIRTVGSIEYDESRLATISAYVGGRIERMFANYEGVEVQQGGDLALLYSPKLYSAQAEYVSAYRRSLAAGEGQRGLSGDRLLAVARENLRELGMSPTQIDQLGESLEPQARIRITSPVSGTVLDKAVLEGDYVETGEVIYRVANLETVWLMLELFPDDAARLRFGQQVEAEVRSLPGQVLTGRVAFIAPTVDAETRTVEVRVEMLNLDGELRPGDYASAQIRIPAADLDEIYDPALAGKFISPMHPQVIRDTPGDCPLCGMELVPTSQYGFAEAPIAAQQVTTIPRSAVLIGGDQSVVYVETEPGRFEIREVALGPVTSDRAVILRGVAPGEAVATEGNFLIDSQMQLSGNPSLLDPRKATEFAPGPLRLPNSTPRLFSGATGDRLDQTYAAYFAIQRRLSQDMAPASATVSQLITQLRALESDPQLSDQVQLRIGAARRAAPRLDGPLDEARLAFRRLSHALLRVAPLARGPQTAIDFVHYYCPMVPGGGGDWLQREGPLANPYWGAEMLRCGEAAGTLSAVGPTSNASRTE